MANLGCLELHPHPVRAEDLEHPDELRVDLDPVPGVGWEQILEVAQCTRETISDFGLVGWPKTSGSRGFHVYCRIERRWTFADVRPAAVALAGAGGALEPLLALAAEHEAAGRGAAPWPPQFPKAEGEPLRVQPSRRRQGAVPAPAPGKSAGPTGRRRTTMPLVEIARAATEAEAREGLERWEARHPEVVPHLAPPDVLVDSMRGRSTTWTRIRVNLRNVPENDRPQQEPL